MTPYEPSKMIGKDEVASSNLASSSKKEKATHLSGLFFFYADAGFEKLNADVQWTSACDGLTEQNIYLSSPFKEKINANKSG